MTRRPEIDAFRGVLLLVMALTHLPTRASEYANQALGFVSAAEGFVFLSAFVASSVYSRLLRDQGPREARRRAGLRAVRLYGCHLALLSFTFTVGAALATHMGRPALLNLLSFYFSEPVWALPSAVVLLYQPPLLDILPMYVVFVALTPWALEIAQNRGWWRLLGLSAALWLAAQLGAGTFVYEKLSLAIGWPVPPEALGAFDWLAWQLLWVMGLCCGANPGKVTPSLPAVPSSRYIIGVALAAAVFFFAWRHQFGGRWFGLGDEPRVLDKWHLGPLRLVNFAAWAILTSTLVLPVFARLRVGTLSLLGRASLPVFVTHLLVCITSLGVVVDGAGSLRLAQEIGVLAASLASMLFVAWRHRFE
ncbi:MAG TPA: OpgC domain-containing protein [Steroidobacteraceae bacterium]|nr:OpgC domain-containing protein [Steroidobacteraceae bacterium]